MASKEVEITDLCLKCLRCWDIIACFNSSVLHLLLEISVMRHIANLRTFQSITSTHQKWINRGVNLDTFKVGWSSNPKNQYQASSLCLSLHLYIGIFHRVSRIDTRLWWIWKRPQTLPLVRENFDYKTYDSRTMHSNEWWTTFRFQREWPKQKVKNIPSIQKVTEGNLNLVNYINIVWCYEKRAKTDNKYVFF